MTAEVLHVSALVATAAGACCAAGGRRDRSAVEIVTAVVMVGAMAHSVFAWNLVAPVLWAALLLALALAEAVLHRAQAAGAPAGNDRVGPPSARMLALHSPVGAIVMAAMLVGSSTTTTTAAAAPHSHAIGLAGLTLAGLLGYVGLTVWTGWLVRASAWRLAQVLSMGGAALLMGGGMLA